MGEGEPLLEEILTVHYVSPDQDARLALPALDKQFIGYVVWSSTNPGEPSTGGSLYNILVEHLNKGLKRRTLYRLALTDAALGDLSGFDAGIGSTGASSAVSFLDLALAMYNARVREWAQRDARAASAEEGFPGTAGREDPFDEEWPW